MRREDAIAVDLYSLRSPYACVEEVSKPSGYIHPGSVWVHSIHLSWMPRWKAKMTAYLHCTTRLLGVIHDLLKIGHTAHSGDVCGLGHIMGMPILDSSR